MKFMSKKRFATGVLASAMALSMVSPAMAAGEKQTVVTGEYKAITLAVTVPTTGKAVVNPYGLPIELDEETSVSGQQITTGAPLVISNQSKVALAVKANVKGETKGTGVAFTTDAVAADETAKKINANFEAFRAPGVLDDTDAAELNAMFAGLESTNAVLKGAVAADAADATGTLVLREGDEEGATQDGGSAFFRLSGTVTKSPTTAWAAGDGFSATIAFTFEPAEYVGSVTLKAAGDAKQVTVGDTLDVSVDLPSGVRVAKGTLQWVSAKTENITVAADDANTSTTKLAATVTGVTEVNTGVKVYVTFKGTDGVTYKSNELSLKCVAA